MLTLHPKVGDFELFALGDGRAGLVFAVMSHARMLGMIRPARSSRGFEG
jgi:hypothetical protein